MNSKAIYIGLGILLGLAIAYIGYTYIQTNELNALVELQKKEITTLQNDLKEQQDSLNSLNAKYHKQKAETNTSKKEEDLVVENTTSEEDVLWDITKQANTFDAYINYLSHEKSKSSYLNEVNQQLNELGKKGWLYAGRTKDNISFSEDQIVEVIWRDSDDNSLRKAVPKIGDVLLLKTSTSRRTYSNYSPRENQNGAWEKDQKAYVIDVKMEGPTAVIIKIAYK